MMYELLNDISEDEILPVILPLAESKWREKGSEGSIEKLHQVQWCTGWKERFVLFEGTARILIP